LNKHYNEISAGLKQAKEKLDNLGIKVSGSANQSNKK
jgi:hypothetical protein